MSTSSLMDIHHDTSLKFILEDDSISSAFRTRIRSCSSKGARLWLIVKPSIYLLYITHFIFILTLCFHLNLIQPSTFSLFMCECEHGLDTYGTHLAHCSFDIHTWCHLKRHVCPHSREWARCMERTMVRLYVKSFITHWFLHDSRGPSCCCRCAGY